MEEQGVGKDEAKGEVIGRESGHTDISQLSDQVSYQVNKYNLCHKLL
jgi:hypothetical protein